MMISGRSHLIKIINFKINERRTRISSLNNVKTLFDDLLKIKFRLTIYLAGKMFFAWSKYHQFKFVNKKTFYYFASRQISTRFDHALNDLSISLMSVSSKFLLRSAGVPLASTNFILMRVSTAISCTWTPSPQFLLFIEMEVTGMVRHHPRISFLIHDLHRYNGRKE